MFGEFILARRQHSRMYAIQSGNGMLWWIFDVCKFVEFWFGLRAFMNSLWYVSGTMTHTHTDVYRKSNEKLVLTSERLTCFRKLKIVSKQQQMAKHELTGILASETVFSTLRSKLF